jgi:otoferlin
MYIDYECVCLQPQHALPDVFVWMIANGKRIAYHRISARDLIFSPEEEECGIHCGKMQTVFLKVRVKSWFGQYLREFFFFFQLPGKHATGPTGWLVRAKLSIYFWLGTSKHKKHFYEGLPKGYEMAHELRNAERAGALAPSNIHYVEKYIFQMRAHIYQARSLIGSDASGLSDPYAVVHITEFAKTTQVIEETLSPTWDELLVFDEVLVYGSKEEIKKDLPTIVVEIYDQDKVGKSEFIGRAIAKPRIKLKEMNYVTPTLEWFEVTRGLDNAGELLAAFELLEIGSTDIPRLTEPKFVVSEVKPDRANSSFPPPSTILPVPRDVRPHLAKFRIEVLFWGLRDLKRVHFMTVDKPRIDIECSGKILSSSIIQNAKKNPNFANMLKFFDLELPMEELYAPPITVRAVDCRSFGRYTLVGTHQITSIHKYMHPSGPREDMKRNSTTGQIILSRPITQTGETMVSHPINHGPERRKSSCENLTLYGAACVSKVCVAARRSKFGVWLIVFCSFAVERSSSRRKKPLLWTTRVRTWRTMTMTMRLAKTGGPNTFCLMKN